jgi:anti-sigma28 factor (negative regulator of flagellin synthesis)
MKSSQERQDERREKKLEEVKQQIASGSLTIRQMTPAERKSNPPRPPKPKRS